LAGDGKIIDNINIYALMPEFTKSFSLTCSLFNNKKCSLVLFLKKQENELRKMRYMRDCFKSPLDDLNSGFNKNIKNMIYECECDKILEKYNDYKK